MYGIRRLLRHRNVGVLVHHHGAGGKKFEWTSCFANHSTLIRSDIDSETDESDSDDQHVVERTTDGGSIHRLQHMRNVGVFAHVDAGKTTVTERMLALAGVVRQAGSVDDGNTVTDYLPAERERGITIQCAAISFPWAWHNNKKSNSNHPSNVNNSGTVHNTTNVDDDYKPNDNVTIALIDTPGHVDFSVEVNRSVAVLDGAVLVIDAVAGVQAQTETVWKAMTNPSQMNNHVLTSSNADATATSVTPAHHHHEPLPCLVLINKMDKDGCHFLNSMESIRRKLPGANPIPIQLPLFKKISTDSSDTTCSSSGTKLMETLVAIPITDGKCNKNDAVRNNNRLHSTGDFVGVVDLIHMRAIVWPDNISTNNCSLPENCIPSVLSLLLPDDNDVTNSDCHVTRYATEGRWKLVEALAECGDTVMEEYYLQEVHPSNCELRAAVRRVTLTHKGVPVLAAAALRGKGIEPVLDAIADYLPSPLDREAPDVVYLDRQQQRRALEQRAASTIAKHNATKKAQFGHPLHPSLLAFAFKVVHMKGRGGSGDGRVVFARVYSGTLRDKDVVQAISPSLQNVDEPVVRKERIGGMLELAGGRFSTVQHGECKSGGVCALVGLKTVVTGDTIVMYPSTAAKKHKKDNKDENRSELVCLAGVASPKPVLKVRLEAESSAQQTKLSEALALMAIEDPSLVVEETASSTLLSGLGELHIEVTLDRLKREYGLNVFVGSPSVTYRESIAELLETNGLHNFDRMVGGTRLQASIHILLKPTWNGSDVYGGSACMMLTEPTVTVSDAVKEYMGYDCDKSDDDILHKSELFRALVHGCKGALKRGPIGSYAMANMNCHVVAIDAENGLPGLQALPGALRAATADAISTLLSKNRSSSCTVLEPKMSLEITLPNDMVGTVLSDLSGRRGTIGDVHMGEVRSNQQSKALIRGEVPLIEILGYANSLRSITGGEGAFTAEYEGHSPCEM